MHRLLMNQIAKTTMADGAIDGARLLDLISLAYDQFDKDRVRSDRATRLMIEEVEAAKAAEDEARAERELKEAEASKLREREKTAEAASRAKSAFLAVMSHEIRTPMNAVLGLASVLLGSEMTDEQRKIVSTIHDSGENLLQILNDILDYSKIEAGQLALELIPFSPKEIISNAVSIIQPRASAKGLSMDVVLEPMVPEAVIGDPGRLRQVVLNLISNAVKFTERGSIVVTLSCIAKSATSAAIQCAIKDTGIGISEDRIGTLFHDFVQADCTINRRFGGTGLGLSISKRIIDNMGGSMHIASDVGKGTEVRFIVNLPLTQATTGGEPERVDDAEQLADIIAKLGRPLRVLIVDDNATNRLVAAKILGPFNIQSDQAADGTEAVATTAQFDYDVVLMDIRMPEMDGLAATRAIRTRQARNAATPIIAFTANAFPDDLDACRQAGMNAFVAKPVRKAQMVQSLIQSLRPLKEVPTTTMSTQNTEVSPHNHADAAIAALDREMFDELAEALGPEGIAEASQMFLAETVERIDAIRKLAQGSDRVTLGREAHTIKGTAATFGFLRLSQVSGELERAMKAGTDIDCDDFIKRIANAFAAGSQLLSSIVDMPAVQAA